MNEHLLVNSKTDILEFKRKHNLLVANGTIKATVSNVKELTNDVINNLRCGDVVLKEDSSGKHAYLVSFKSDTGLCLTYVDASCVETQSYDKSGNNWVYNSEDKSELPVNIGNPLQVFDGYIIALPEGVSASGVFCKVVRNFNELQFIMNCRISNASGETFTISGDTPMCYFANLPDYYLERIFNHSGQNLKNANSSTIAATKLFSNATNGLMISGIENNTISMYWNSDTQRIVFYNEGAAIEIETGHTIDFEARISLAL